MTIIGPYYTPYSYRKWDFRLESMADRKAELEKKRKKLDELRQARERKKTEAKDKEVIILDNLHGLSLYAVMSCVSMLHVLSFWIDACISMFQCIDP